jgi:hypothetical protein
MAFLPLKAVSFQLSAVSFFETGGTDVLPVRMCVPGPFDAGQCPANISSLLVPKLLLGNQFFKGGLRPPFLAKLSPYKFTNVFFVTLRRSRRVSFFLF